jgi:chromosome segregation ATPase
LTLELERTRDHTFAVLSEVIACRADSVPATHRADVVFQKACCMSDPGAVPEAQDIAETTHFLRRFASLMANGQNATYLHRTADLLETLAARVSASSDEEQLWRYKYETLSQQNDAIEHECEELRHDIERHVKLSSSIIAERDVHKTALDARETELRELGEALKREREALEQERQKLATLSQAHTQALAEQRSAFDQERSAGRSRRQRQGNRAAAHCLRA